MKISELIEKLQDLKTVYGDLKVTGEGDEEVKDVGYEHLENAISLYIH